MIDLEDFAEIETENMKKKYVKSSNERLQYGICRGSKRNSRTWKNEGRSVKIRKKSFMDKQ